MNSIQNELLIKISPRFVRKSSGKNTVIRVVRAELFAALATYFVEIKNSDKRKKREFAIAVYENRETFSGHRQNEAYRAVRTMLAHFANVNLFHKSSI